MTYFERQRQLIKTLESITKSEHQNFEIVIVDDASPSHYETTRHENSLLHVITIQPEDKTWNSPAIPQNMGIQKALDLGAEIIILQNAECFWVGDIATYAEEYLTNDNYISFACFSLDATNTFDENINQNLHQIIHANNKDATGDGQNAWYNHGKIRGVGYDFCAAITKENIIKLNGMDERFSEFPSYSDDDFVARQKRLGLKIEIPPPEENPFVCHQWHYTNKSRKQTEGSIEKNRDLYEWINANEHPNYKAKHIVTKDFE